MMYKLYKSDFDLTKPNAVMTIGVELGKSFLFDPANTDYANFKKEILADEAQLQDAEGVIMTDAKAYVASLP